MMNRRSTGSQPLRTRALGRARLSALSVALILCIQPLRPVSGQTDITTALDKFRERYEAGLQKHGIIGSSFVFLQNGKVVSRLLWGSANLEKKQPVTDRTIYHWASITKTFTGIAIMQLRDRGKLKLDDPIIKYIPELRAVHDPFGDMSEVTLRQLMSHSAGFRGATWPWGGDLPWHPHEPATWSQLAGMFPYTEILFKPGSKFSYSNPGIVFLGRVIELLSGEDFEVYIEKNIFKPLEMHRSYFDSTPYYLLNDRSQSYYLKAGKLEPARFDADTGITVSNGGLNAPFDDMVKYVNFLLGSGSPQIPYDMVLKRSSLEEMWEPQVELPVSRDGRNRRDRMGLTFFIEDNYDQHFIGHSGDQNGFIAHFYINPAAKSGYIVNFNTNAISEAENNAQNTRVLDRELKEFLFERVFPLTGGR
jgi:CubicO group peptidase (beta-lactamase class C family)